MDMFALGLSTSVAMVLYLLAVIAFSTVMTFVGEFVTGKVEKAVLRLV